MTGYTVEYSNDLRTVYVIPMNGVPLDDMEMLMNYFRDNGYKYWLRADGRGAYVYSKDPSPNGIEE